MTVGHAEIAQRRRRRSPAQGATVLRGVWGFHGDHRRRGDTLFRLDRRLPVVTVIAGSTEGIAESFGVVDEITGDYGPVASEMVPAQVSVHGDDRDGGTRLADCRYGGTPALRGGRRRVWMKDQLGITRR